MSDWSTYELEDISWEEFGTSDDHIVPRCDDKHAHGSISHDDSCKKQQHEVGTAVIRANNEPAAFQKTDKIFDNSSLVDGRSLLVESNVNNTFQSSLADISPEDKELQLLQYAKNRENNVILDCEWDDIDNFENVDRMFRNNGTAFTQGSIESADELSWFSSSLHTIDECEDTFNFGIQSSYPEFSASTRSLKLNQANMSFLLEKDSVPEVCDHSSLGYCANTNWLDADVEVSESMGGDKTEVSAITQNGKRVRTRVFKDPDMHFCQLKLPKGQYNTAARRKNDLSETTNGFYVHNSDITQPFEGKNDLSSASSFQTCPSPPICHQTPSPKVDSFKHSNPCDYHVKMENDPVTQEISVKKCASCVQSEVRSNISPSCKVGVHTTNYGQQSMGLSSDALSGAPTMVAEDTIDKIHHEKQSRVLLDTGKACENIMNQDSSSNQIILQNKSFTSQGEVEGDTELAEMSIECPKFEMDYLAVQESSTITAFSDDISLGSASFRKLQDMLDQLDIRTKLCIRDGLYRLARNAEMRHCIDNIKHVKTGSTNSSRIPRMEESTWSYEFIVETGTNLIDRSIAHLLFYRASDSSTSPINYALSHESHITNEQSTGSRTMPSNA